MVKSSRFFVFGLVCLGLAGLVGVSVLARPSWADCGNQVCSTTQNWCSQTQSGSCPGCVAPTLGASCAGQPIITVGSGNYWYGAMNQTGTYVGWVPVCCVEYATCSGNTQTGFCYYGLNCVPGDDQCQPCSMGPFNFYSSVMTCINCGKCQGSS